MIKPIHATAAILMLALLIGCQGHEPEKIKIGILTPTSGSLAFLGENIVRSAELAAEDLGYADRVEFIVEDAGDVGGGRSAVSAYRKLVDVDKVVFIIDGMSSDGTMAVAPLLDADQVVMVTPLTGGENIDNAAEYLFRNGPSDIRAGTQPAEDIYRAGYAKVALFTDNAEYTLDISKHFRAAFNGTIVVDEIIEPDRTDYRTALLKLQGQEVDAIVINTASGASAAYLMKELHEAGVRKPVFANFLAFGSSTLQIAGEGAEGAYIYYPEFDEDAPATRRLMGRYEERYGTMPPIPFHTTGTYDAVRMGVEAAEAGARDGAAIRECLLEHIRGWQGLNGNVTFDSKGNVQTGFTLKRISSGTLADAELS